MLKGKTGAFNRSDKLSGHWKDRLESGVWFHCAVGWLRCIPYRRTLAFFLRFSLVLLALSILYGVFFMALMMLDYEEYGTSTGPHLHPDPNMRGIRRWASVLSCVFVSATRG